MLTLCEQAERWGRPSALANFSCRLIWAGCQIDGDASLFVSRPMRDIPSQGKFCLLTRFAQTVLLTMLGNIVSALLWLFSTSFSSFLLSRLVGGLSEGNVQLAIAIISDVTSPETRAKSLALVGIAFSIAFTTGPPLGAYLASKMLPSGENSVMGVYVNVYALPAAITLFLLIVETLYIAFALPETRHARRAASQPETHRRPEKSIKAIQSVEKREKNLQKLRRLHFYFLFFFSGEALSFIFLYLTIAWTYTCFFLFVCLGAEFSLTFLTYDLVCLFEACSPHRTALTVIATENKKQFGFSNMQNGRLLGFIGILSSLIQGGYVRRAGKPAKLAKLGIMTCALALVLLSSLPYIATRGSAASTATSILYGAGALLAFTSGTVVNSLTALASMQTDDEADEGAVATTTTAAAATTATTGNEPTKQQRVSFPKGAVLGSFRSTGQLGRTLGPIFSTSVRIPPSLSSSLLHSDSLSFLFV
jgi:MFS family permease